MEVRDKTLLAMKQALPLATKVQMAKRRIREFVKWAEVNHKGAHISFSGGKDSTVLLHLVRSMYDRERVPAVFVNTGLEFPEIVDFVKESDGGEVVMVRPAKSFRQVIEDHGYPVVSKRVAQYVGEVQSAGGSKAKTATVRLRTTGIKSNGDLSKLGKVSDKWQHLFDAPFKISDKCCKHLKKDPLINYERRAETMPMTGVMACDSMGRRLEWIDTGCNAFDQKHPQGKPLSVWTEDDIWQYLRENEVPYSTIYDMGYAHTGCIFCMFGVQMEKPRDLFGEGGNRFQLLRKTHPKLWDYCINKLGCKQVLQSIGVPYK